VGQRKRQELGAVGGVTLGVLWSLPAIKTKAAYCLNLAVCFHI